MFFRNLYNFVKSAIFIIVVLCGIYVLNNNVIFPTLIKVPAHIQEHFSESDTTLFGARLEDVGESIKDHIEDFKYVVHRIALIGGVEGIVLIIFGFLSSLFSLGIELIVIGWVLLGVYVTSLLGFLYMVHYFVKYELYTLAGLETKMSLWHIYAVDIAMLFAFLILLFILVRMYIKRYHARERAQR